MSTFFTATAIRPKPSSHVLARLPPSRPAAVGVAAPHRVDLGQVGVVAPVARVDQREQARAVGARLGAEHAGGGPAPGGGLSELVQEPVAILERVLAREVALGRLATVGILTFKGILEGTCGGQEFPLIHGTSVYARDGDDWKLAFTLNHLTN